MQKIFIEFQYKVNEKEFRVQCEPNCPIPDAKEVAYLFLKEIGQIEDQQKQQLAESAKQEAEKQIDPPKE